MKIVDRPLLRHVKGNNDDLPCNNNNDNDNLPCNNNNNNNNNNSGSNSANSLLAFQRDDRHALTNWLTPNANDGRLPWGLR